MIIRINMMVRAKLLLLQSGALLRPYIHPGTACNLNVYKRRMLR